MVSSPMQSFENDDSTPLESGPRNRDPDFFLARLAPETQNALSIAQLDDIRSVIAQALPQPQPKVVDIRFVINLLFDRYYLVLFMGKDLRRRSRTSPTWLTRLSNLAVALLLLVSMNLFISLTLGMVMYLIKSAAGIDLFPGHLSDVVESI